jgi:pSer/pThr/pTyr-binding forkhead associated (FHA) protein
VRCPNCDALNPPDRRFCDECGQALQASTVAAPPAAGAVTAVDEATLPYLETLSRVDDQLEFVLARDLITIGRDPASDIVIDDQFVDWQTVAPRHARLTRQGDGFIVEDLGSESGTFINGVRTGQNLLEDGMTIGLGKVEFVYRVPQV